jgi:dienelactone hydrolase
MGKIDRRMAIARLMALGAAPAFARFGAAEEQPNRDVPWLAEIQQPPAALPDDAPRLSELLVDRDGRRIATLAAWQARREELRQAWLEFLGPMPTERKGAPKLEVMEEDRVPPQAKDSEATPPLAERADHEVIRQLVRYEVEPGLSTEAYLLKPASFDGKLPGIAVFHSTVDHSIRQPAGLEGAPEKAFGLRLARRGCVALCPRNFLWPKTHGIAAQAEARKFLERMPRSKGMAKMLFDALVAVDILESLPQVDRRRLGCVGHSLGAKETLYLAAFDERMKATVSSEGGIGTRFSNWDAPWYLGPTIKEPGFMREHHELLALAAPRAFLLAGGDSADGDRGWPFIAAALRVYELYGRPARLGQFNHKQGHAVPPEAERRIEQWLLTYL